MGSISLSLLTSLLILTLPVVNSVSSPKRGLIYVDPASPSDDNIWTQASQNLTWYYNYEYIPTPSLLSSSSSSNNNSLSFVPMLWGSPPSPTSPDSAFQSALTTLLDSPTPPSHILSFNEPDGPPSTGGSSLSPSDAATAYLLNLAPLRLPPYNLKISLPAVTGSPQGISWLQEFNTSCQTHPLSPPDGRGCEADFLPLHFYGSFEGFASHIGQMRALYPTTPMWITEYALPESGLEETQRFFNMSVEYLERLDYVERYAWFGAFRSDDSNVGGNVAFLSKGGGVTDLGGWYLGSGGTGNAPEGESRGGRASMVGSGGFLVVMMLVWGAVWMGLWGA